MNDKCVICGADTKLIETPEGDFVRCENCGFTAMYSGEDMKGGKHFKNIQDTIELFEDVE